MFDIPGEGNCAHFSITMFSWVMKAFVSLVSLNHLRLTGCSTVDHLASRSATHGLGANCTVDIR